MLSGDQQLGSTALVTRPTQVGAGLSEKRSQVCLLPGSMPSLSPVSPDSQQPSILPERAWAERLG